ncbi:radical SAM protein [Geomesophilobacter sediminis]|uniref:Radical SAM protein n=1 Tax=Geomesophilobacter sediminis TaxID=2798584 RepID=A0A8J7JCZ4_9BACT|nr:radical SAM protein [Geomesophilobacter sediminis]MBJ6724838.1 radical SAM protein [Geomesophilobacter sediminis]
MIYFNFDAIVAPPLATIPQELIEQEMKKQAETGKTSMAILNSNCEIVEKPEVYYASRKLGLPGVFGQFMTVINNDMIFPDRFSLELTNHCNFSCKMCPRSVMTRKKEFMSRELFCKIVDEIHEFSKVTAVNKVDLYRLGESTLHPDFGFMLDYIGKLDTPFPTQLATNGSRLDEKMIRKIMDSSLTYLVLSFNAQDAETYRNVTGGAELSQTIKALQNLKRFRTKRTPFIMLQFVEQEGTHDKLEEFVKEYIDSCDIVISSSLEDFGGQLKQNSAYVEKHILGDGDGGDRLVCPRGVWRRAMIYVNGDVVPCICDINASYTKMGNVTQSSIKEIFDSPQWAEFVAMHKECGEKLLKHPLCGPCSEWKIMTGYNKRFTPKIVSNQ